MPMVRPSPYGVYEGEGENLSVSRGTSVTGGAANTKGSYVQLTASTAIEADGFWLQVDGGSGIDDYLFDIAVGASSSEVDIISNYLATLRNLGGTVVSYWSIPIPVGTRISARVQETTGSVAARVSLTLVNWGQGKTASYGSVTTYGANTADSGGVQIDPGGVANTKGAYSEITSSTSKAHKAIAICIGGQDNAVRNAAGWYLYVAVGGAGSEVDIIDGLGLTVNTAGDMIAPNFYGPFPVNIPASTRLAVAAQCSDTDATDRLIDVTIHGLS